MSVTPTPGRAKLGWTLLLLGIFSAAAAPAAAASIYLFDEVGGGFLELSTDPWRVSSLWSLEEVAGLAPRVPRGPIDGPRLEDLAYDPEYQRLFLVLPDDAEVDEDGAKAFRVVLASLPRFDVMAELRLPQKLVVAPRLLLRPRHGELFVQWEDREAARAAGGEVSATVITVLGRTDLKPRRTLRSEIPRAEAASTPAPIFFPWARFDPAEERIYAGNKVLRFTDDGVVAEMPDLLRGLDAQTWERLKQRYPDHPRTGKPWIRRVLADAAGDLGLVHLSGDPQTDSVETLWVTDLRSGSGDTFIEVPPSRSTFVAGGRRILAQEVTPLVPGTAQSATGRVRIYDTDSGELRQELSSELLAGSVRVVHWLCDAPDGDGMLWRGGDGRPVLVEPERGRAEALRVDFSPSPRLGCVVVQ